MRHRRWLAAAALLFVLAAWLMSRRDAAPPARELASVEFPRHLRAKERERLAQRRTLPAPVPVPAPDAPTEPTPEPPRRDPLIAALPPPGPDESAVVVEVNALRHSPVGELFLRCAFGEEDQRTLEEIRTRLGIDPLDDLDRVAFAGKTVVVTGQLATMRWDELLAGVPTRSYGEKGRIWGPQADDESLVIGAWNSELAVFGPTAADVEATMDRLEGRAAGAPAFAETSSYGDVYGVLSAKELAELMGPEQQVLAERLQGAAERIELHLDASGDVALVAEVRGPQVEQVQDLGKSLGAALAVARLQAKTDGQDELVELLDLARVQPSDGTFTLELALPLSLLERHLCRDRRPANGAPTAAERREDAPPPDGR